MGIRERLVNLLLPKQGYMEITGAVIAGFGCAECIHRKEVVLGGVGRLTLSTEVEAPHSLSITMTCKPSFSGKTGSASINETLLEVGKELCNDGEPCAYEDRIEELYYTLSTSETIMEAQLSPHKFVVDENGTRKVRPE